MAGVDESRDGSCLCGCMRFVLLLPAGVAAVHSGRQGARHGLHHGVAVSGQALQGARTAQLVLWLLGCAAAMRGGACAQSSQRKHTLMQQEAAC
jgi:hypothetical protein